jgi:hypothetical protein
MGFLLCLVVCLSVKVFAQTTGHDTEKPDWAKGFVFNLALYADAFRYDKSEFGNAALRKSASDQNTEAVSLSFSNLDWVSDDSTVSFGYQSDRFGGKYTFKKSNVTNFGAVQGWVKFGNENNYLRIVAGNDNDSTYADPLGADPGPRVYTGGTGSAWKATLDPDNITQGNGILFNGYFGSLLPLGALTIDLAGSRYTVTPRKTTIAKPGTLNEYGDTEDMDIQAGARLGYEIAGLGRVNLSYNVGYVQIGSKYGWDTVNRDIVPQAADAETWNHRFNAAVSITPFKDFSVTLGYSGIITKYRDDYWTLERSEAVWAKTTYPQIGKHAVNLNIRYGGLAGGRLMLRTDHNFTFYADKNYLAFELAGASWAQDFNPTSLGTQYAEIGHYFLWNHLRAEYDLVKSGADPKLRLILALRNLYRLDTASSGVIEQDYELTRDEFMADFQVKYFFNSSTSAFVGLRFQDMITIRSKDLAGQNAGIFLDSMKMPGSAVELKDSIFSFSIPVGMNITW